MSVRRLAYLPIITYPDPVPEDALAGAVEMAARLDADVHAAAFSIDIPPVLSPTPRVLLNVPELIRTTEERSRENCNIRIGWVQKQCSRLSINLTSSIDAIALGDMSVVASQARYYDFSILPWWEHGGAMREVAETVIFGAGRPSILVPQGAVVGDVAEIAVAWDGSRVAARALADAMLFVSDRSRIIVLTVIDEKELSDKNIAMNLVTSLERRGLKAQAETVRAGDSSISTALQHHALKLGAKMLVMGGYGHSRLRDFVLGGATKGVLSDLKLPILLSH